MQIQLDKQEIYVSPALKDLWRDVSYALSKQEVVTLEELISCLDRQSVQHNGYQEFTNNFKAKLKRRSFELGSLASLYTKLAKLCKDQLKQAVGETKEVLLTQLKYLYSLIALISQIIVTNLRLLTISYQATIFGKGIEGFIPYKTWARPPSIGQHFIIITLRIFIDMLSRPGNYQTDVSYA